MREVTQGKNHVLVNGSPIHLRGTVENAVFPQTGYAPVDDASWGTYIHYFERAWYESYAFPFVVSHQSRFPHG